MQTSADATPTGNTYDKYASANPIERRMMSGFFTALDESLPSVAPASVLEVGAGEGEVAVRVRQRFPDASLRILDLPDDDLRSHWRQLDLAGTFGSVEDLPFPDRSFDLVLGIEMLEHVPDPTRALEELHRVCRGHAVFSVPREPIWRILNMGRGKYLRDLGNTPGHIQHWSSKRFADAVGERFHVDAVRTPLPWTMVAASATH